MGVKHIVVDPSDASRFVQKEIGSWWKGGMLFYEKLVAPAWLNVPLGLVPLLVATYETFNEGGENVMSTFLNSLDGLNFRILH